MDSSVRTRMKRAKVLAGEKNGKSLNRKDRIDRSLFAGNPVLFYGVQQGTVCPCTPLQYPQSNVCPASDVCAGGCNESFLCRHQI